MYHREMEYGYMDWTYLAYGVGDCIQNIQFSLETAKLAAFLKDFAQLLRLNCILSLKC